MRNESGVAFVLVMLIVSGAVGVVTWNGGTPSVANAGSTSTTNQTISCPTLNPTQTSQNSGIKLPDYGHLLGNFSAITVVENAYESGANITILASLQVLNRSFKSSPPVYLVNVTVQQVLSDLTTTNSNGLTTTTFTNSGSQTQMGSVKGLVVSNGSMISIRGSSGDFAATQQLTTYPLEFFGPLLSLGATPSSPLHPVNGTVVTIGSYRMVVTNYVGPTIVLAESIEGCGSVPSTTTTVGTFSDSMLQVGRVPGTDFILATRFSESISLQSNSTATSGSPSFASEIVYRVTSFKVG